MNEQAYEARWTWWSRLLWRLFPGANFPSDEQDTRTFLRTTVRVQLGWRDRLRLLVSPRCCVKVTTYTDVEVTVAQSLSVFYVEPPLA